MPRAGRALVKELNPHLVCVLCGGYFIDATTIIECLHSFCRSCIVRYLETSKYCPICDVQVHKTRPLASVRQDKILQNLVYKLVPGLLAGEVKKRKAFCTDREDEDNGRLLCIEDGNNLLFADDEKISFSLEYSINGRPIPEKRKSTDSRTRDRKSNDTLKQDLPNVKVETSMKEESSENRSSQLCDQTNGSKSTTEGQINRHVSTEANMDGPPTDDKTCVQDSMQKSENKQAPVKKERQDNTNLPEKRYLLGPAALTIAHMKKFVRMKFDLPSNFEVDVFNNEEILNEAYSLMDVAYIFSWKRKAPLRFFYTIYEVHPRKKIKTSRVSGRKDRLKRKSEKTADDCHIKVKQAKLNDKPVHNDCPNPKTAAESDKLQTVEKTNIKEETDCQTTQPTDKNARKNLPVDDVKDKNKSPTVKKDSKFEGRGLSTLTLMKKTTQKQESSMSKSSENLAKKPHNAPLHPALPLLTAHAQAQREASRKGALLQGKPLPVPATSPIRRQAPQPVQLPKGFQQKHTAHVTSATKLDTQLTSPQLKPKPNTTQSKTQPTMSVASAQPKPTGVNAVQHKSLPQIVQPRQIGQAVQPRFSSQNNTERGILQPKHKSIKSAQPKASPLTVRARLNAQSASNGNNNTLQHLDKSHEQKQGNKPYTPSQPISNQQFMHQHQNQAAQRQQQKHQKHQQMLQQKHIIQQAHQQPSVSQTKQTNQTHVMQQTKSNFHSQQIPQTKQNSQPHQIPPTKQVMMKQNVQHQQQQQQQQQNVPAHKTLLKQPSLKHQQHNIQMQQDRQQHLARLSPQVQAQNASMSPHTNSTYQNSYSKSTALTSFSIPTQQSPHNNVQAPHQSPLLQHGKQTQPVPQNPHVVHMQVAQRPPLLPVQPPTLQSSPPTLQLQPVNVSTPPPGLQMTPPTLQPQTPPIILGPPSAIPLLHPPVLQPLNLVTRGSPMQTASLPTHSQPHLIHALPSSIQAMQQPPLLMSQPTLMTSPSHIMTSQPPMLVPQSSMMHPPPSPIPTHVHITSQQFQHLQQAHATSQHQHQQQATLLQGQAMLQTSQSQQQQQQPKTPNSLQKDRNQFSCFPAVDGQNIKQPTQSISSSNIQRPANGATSPVKHTSPPSVPATTSDTISNVVSSNLVTRQSHSITDSVDGNKKTVQDSVNYCHQQNGKNKDTALESEHLSSAKHNQLGGNKQHQKFKNTSQNDIPVSEKSKPLELNQPLPDPKNNNNDQMPATSTAMIKSNATTQTTAKPVALKSGTSKPATPTSTGSLNSVKSVDERPESATDLSASNQQQFSQTKINLVTSQSGNSSSIPVSATSTQSQGSLTTAVNNHSGSQPLANCQLTTHVEGSIQTRDARTPPQEEPLELKVNSKVPNYVAVS